MNYKRTDEERQSHINSIIGNKYGMLTVVGIDRQEQGLIFNKVYYNCTCDCGQKDIIRNANTLTTSKSFQSCGCYKKDKLREMRKKYNEYNLNGEFGIGYTTNTNEEFYFDLDDYNLIKNYCWYKTDGYIIAYDSNSKKHIRMHRLILGVNDDRIIDHKNHTMRHDNRKSNIRIANRQTNDINRSHNKNNKLGIKGVHWSDKRNAFIAQIMINGKQITIGEYDSTEEAESARIKYEVEHFKDFSVYKNAEKYKYL